MHTGRVELDGKVDTIEAENVEEAQRLFLASIGAVKTDRYMTCVDINAPAPTSDELTDAEIADMKADAAEIQRAEANPDAPSLNSSDDFAGPSLSPSALAAAAREAAEKRLTGE